MTTTPLPSLDALDVDNRRVFVRVDFNVPTDGDAITDDSRIRASLPTLRALRERGARVIVASHLGRPDGAVDLRYSMEPVAVRLAELLDCEVRLPDEVVGDGVSRLVTQTRAESVVMLENLRFHPGETADDADFARSLASLCDAYVNDAFGVSHRAHASVHALPKLVFDRAAGLLLAAEIAALSGVITPKRPFVAIVGGAKVSDKLGVLLSFVERLSPGDAILIGGAMANTFLLARGAQLGASRVERSAIHDARRVLDKAQARDITVHLPVDVRAATSPEATSGQVRALDGPGLAADELALDIGPATQRAFAATIAKAATVFWNGPMGVFERAPFSEGTFAVARAVADCPGMTVVGGGDSVAAIVAAGVADRVDHVSTGGGASLEFVEGRTLPGIAALERAP